MGNLFIFIANCIGVLKSLYQKLSFPRKFGTAPGKVPVGHRPDQAGGRFSVFEI